MQNPQELLNQEFLNRRNKNPNFSLRSFAKWLQISPAQLSQMMTGKRTITLKSLKKISDRLALSPVEKKKLMESFLNEKKWSEPTTSKKLLNLEEDQFRLIADWFHFAILSLTQIKGAQANPLWIARRLGISIEQASQALLRLERMKIIQTKPIFKQISPPFEVVSSVPSEAIRKYHRQNLGLALEKIDTVPVNLREYQSISIPLNPNQVKVLKKNIDELLNQASELSNRKEATEVYSMSVQLFPVTTVAEDK